MQRLGKDLSDAQEQLNSFLADPKVLSDLAKRSAAAPGALAALARVDAAFDAIAAAEPRAAQQMKFAHAEVMEYRAAFGEAAAVAKIDAMATDPDPATALRGKIAQFNVRWLTAGDDKDAQKNVADAMTPLAKEHLDNAALTMVLIHWATASDDPQLADRLLDTAATMNNPAVAQVAIARQRIAAVRKLEGMEHKPITLTGTLPDGKTFSTADLKGKVVLIDFWATWCGPCKAELPNVKALYGKYHAAGLEIVGVSNDYSADALTGFCAKESIPWPQLYNGEAGGNHAWNPITVGYGINTIPHMFVIDRQGILVSADARTSYEKLIPTLLKSTGG